MSNVNNPHGLMPIMRTLAGGAVQAFPYQKASGGGAIFKWDPVTLLGTGYLGNTAQITPGTTPFLGVALEASASGVAATHNIIIAPDALFEASVRHEQRMAEYGRDGRTGLGGQLLLNGEGDLGNIYTRGTVGAEVRAGWRIPQNQNEPIPLTIDNRDQRSEIRDQRWRVWGSFAVEYSDVAWNYYLRGSPWHTDSNLTSLTPERWVTDYIGGIHIQTPWGWFAGYEYQWRTKEFAQEATDHGWGSITIGKGWIF